MSNVADFYKNQTILLTGVTGFIGKLILEKLLRSCPDLDTVYILIREKKNQNAEERIKALLQEECFDRLRTQNPHFHTKIRVVQGDCSAPTLALSEQTVRTLCDRVTCVVHVAADVRFATCLKSAVATNVRALRELLRLAENCARMRAFVYVSTAFSHCHRCTIGEKFYDCTYDPDRLIETVDLLDDTILDGITKQILGDWPNTYVFTKALGEELVRRYGERLPCAIVRPGIVLPTLEEPLPGWVDNFQGFVGVVSAVAMGVLRSVHGDREAIASVIPADFVVNCVLASAARIKVGQVEIYNAVNADKYALTWGRAVDEMMRFAFKYPTTKAIWYYNYVITTNKWIHNFRVFFLHTVFAHLVDGIFRISGRKPMVVRKYQRINQLLDVLSYFTLRSWHFDCQNYEKLWSDLNESDRQIFSMNMRNFNWSRFLEGTVLGGRLYLLKDPLENLPKARKKMIFLAICHYAFVSIASYVLCKLFVSFFSRMFTA